MNAFTSLPHRFAWSAQQLADAMPRRLSELFVFDAARAGAGSAANEMSRTRRVPRYLRATELPRMFRVC